MRPSGDSTRDLVEVELRRLRVGVGQRECRAGAASGADGAEQIGTLVALVGRLGWPRSASGPLPDAPILLADASLVLEPDLDGLARREACQMGAQCGREVFLKAMTVCPS
jgi:hypothetical protein